MKLKFQVGQTSRMVPTRINLMVAHVVLESDVLILLELY